MRKTDQARDAHNDARVGTAAAPHYLRVYQRLHSSLNLLVLNAHVEAASGHLTSED